MLPSALNCIYGPAMEAEAISSTKPVVSPLPIAGALCLRGEKGRDREAYTSAEVCLFPFALRARAIQQRGPKLRPPVFFFLAAQILVLPLQVPGCGSGPFGVAAVDYLRGLRRRRGAQEPRCWRFVCLSGGAPSTSYQPTRSG